VVLESVDATGRKIKQRNLGMLNAGEHTVNLDVSEFKTGNYVIHLKTPDGNKTGRLIITN
jgi:hypothetical protein